MGILQFIHAKCQSTKQQMGKVAELFVTVEDKKKRAEENLQTFF
jgi:hypothetical protein